MPRFCSLVADASRKRVEGHRATLAAPAGPQVDLLQGSNGSYEIAWLAFGRGGRRRISWAAVGAVLLAAIGLQLTAFTMQARAELLFTDSFESSGLSGWTHDNGLILQTAEAFTGLWGARMTFNPDGSNTGPATYALKKLEPGRSSVYYRLRFKTISQGPEIVNLLRFKTGTGTRLVSVGWSATGRLRYRNDAGGVARTSSITIERGMWHTLQVHVLIEGTEGRVETFYDGAPVAALTRTEALGTAAIGSIELGESTRGASQPYDVAFDDVALDTSLVGGGPPPSDVQPPGPPGALTATATGPDTIALSWTAASDDVGVVAYEIERDGSQLASLGPGATGHVDTTVGAGETHAYRVAAVDAAGNRSQAAGPVTATTPQAALFTDGFESGLLTQWYRWAGVTVVESPVRAGRYGVRAIASGSPAYAHANLSRSATDASVRLSVQIAGPLSTTAYLLKVRTETGASIGGLYLTSRGTLAFRNDVTGTSTTSSTVLAAGTWYDLKLRLVVGEGKVEVWLDGAPMAALTGTQSLGGVAVGRLQIGDISSGRTFDLAFDDVVVDCGC